MADLSSRIDDLSPEKRALLAKLLKQRAARQQQTTIQPRPDPSSYPLSYAQQRLWFLDQLESDSPFYNISGAVHLAGALDVQILESALNKVIRRHEVLRANFITEKGEPVQVIAPILAINLTVEDLRGLDQENRQNEVMRQATAEARAPFRLATDPLIRARLLWVDTDEYVLLITMHHIVSDGWSLKVFIQEIASLYKTFLAGKPSPLPELALQYCDYAEWQRKWLQEEALEKQLGYWKKQLEGCPPALELPAAGPRPSVQTSRGSRITFQVPDALYHDLVALSRAENATLYMTLLAAFQVLLFRYAGQEDICVGTPAANRGRSEIEELIGFFVNTLVMRADLSGQPVFRAFLRQVRERTLAAQANADLPFEMLVDALQIPRDMSVTPLFQVVFTLQEALTNPTLIPGVQSTILTVDSGTAKFDLTLFMEETGTGLQGVFEYNTDLFTHDVIEHMAAHYVNLLAGIAANPDTPVSLLPLLTQQEKRAQLVEWNATCSDYPSERCVHQLFEAQADRDPDAVALVFEGQEITYAELEQRANRLANWLIARGVQPDTLVGVFIERSFDMIVAMLGVLKAGAGYLPIDPIYPPERVLYMLADAGVSIVLTQENLLDQIKEARARIVPMGRVWPEIEQESCGRPACAAGPRTLAYTIYTSGSTGKPKGTLIEHRSTVNFLTFWQNLMKIGPGKRFLQFFSVCFDGSVADIFGALCSGATLYLLTRDSLLSVKGITEFIRDNRIDTAILAPSMLSVLSPDELPGFTTIACGGEKMPPDLAAAWAPGRKLINVYGPTEATVMQAAFPIDDNWQNGTNVPIGRSLPNTQLYILDAQLQPVPVGVHGELYIGGDCLARGYLNQPELTAERFIPNPFSAEPGSRLYKTGDLCRFQPDGVIEYLGRADGQIKIRGFRVELGEIEAQLRSHPAVQEATVLARQDVSGMDVLVAYVVLNEGRSVSQSALRNSLAGQLPDYMVPSIFMFLDEMPLTASGRKIDRKALPVPDLSKLNTGKAYIAPQTNLERYLAAKWQEVLHLERVGVNDNYFELGGNSLQAAVLVNRIQEETREPLQVRSIFLAPTVSGLAAYIEQRHAAIVAWLGDASGASRSDMLQIEIKPTSRDGDLPLSFAQQRLWFLDQFEPDSPFYNISSAVRMRGELDVPALKQSINEIVRRHEVLRTTYHSLEGKAVQRVLPELALDIPVVDLQGLSENKRETEARAQIDREATVTFNLSMGPLLRVSLLRFAPDDHVVLLTMHHIVSDGWSMGVLIQELTALYPAYCSSQPSPLQDLKVQYYDYAAWQRDWLQSEPMQSQVAFWLKYLDGIPPLLELPTDHPRPAMQTYNGSVYEFMLPGNATRQMIEFGQRQGATGFMTLLAAFQVLLARYASQADICVGTPVANRTRHEVEPLIGFFVNTLVLRTSLSGDPTFISLLERVRESVSGAFANQDVPFELLVDRLRPERNLSQSPLFQVMFSLEADQLAGFQLPGLSLSLLPMDTGTAKFDITLNIVQTPDGFTGQIEYNTDLFDPATIERMGSHFTRLLEAVAANPETPISRLDLLSAEERQQVLYEWNQTQADFLLDQPIHRLFEAQVRRCPDTIVVSYKNQSLTYAELNRCANRLAHRLIEMGVGPETVIGLSVERSLEMIVGLLGILKSGAAYLPLDPVYPSDRLAFMLHDTGASIVLTQEHLANRTPAGCQKILLDSGWLGMDQYSVEDCVSPVSEDNAAYIIYTSGSTGTPKGVVVTHRGVANHNQSVARAFALTPADRVLQFATINFDTAVEEIFPTLITGATLVLRPEQELSTGEQLMQLIRDEGLTVLDLPTAYWHEWVRQLCDHPAPLPPSLRLVVVGGEKALPERYEQWRQIAGEQVTWLNTYGPTEGTIIASIYRPPLDQPLPDGRLPIGRPIDNDRIYLLDAHHQPVPVGLPGELYIAGEGVARGYLNRPELTAERFLPDPFVPGSRMYRTGDLARYLPDGNIEYVGRIDTQVKVRGFRIEPGEIENVLRAHPDIVDAVVLPREDTPGVRRLVAYTVARDGRLAAADLRGYLKERLPEYMIPAAFISLETFPLTPSGKVDRKALPAPDLMRPELGSRFAPPETPYEKILAEIWSQVLGIRQIGIHDNFFDLGGDSILSIQVIARANTAGLRLAPRHLFEAQTIAELAILAGETTEHTTEQGPVTGLAALTPIQRWFFEQDLPERSHWNQSILLEVSAPLNRAALEMALASLAEHHDMLRARYSHHGAGWQQNISQPGETIPLEWIDFSDCHNAQAKEEITRQCANLQIRLDITRGPMARAGYFDLGTDRPGRLFLAIHHLVIDGVSWRILLEDLQNAYTQAANGSPVTLPGKTSSYAAWAAALEEYIQLPKAQAEIDTWLSGHGSGILPLPVDFEGETTTEETAVTLSHVFTAEETAALLNRIPSNYHTEPNEELLAALGMALRCWTGRQAFLVELEGHGREDILQGMDLTRTVGWFTTIFPFRLDLVARNDPADVLMGVKELLRRLPNHGIGFGLMRYLHPSAQVRQQMAELPRTEISFNYLGRVSSDMEASSLFRMAQEPMGPEHDPRSPLAHRIIISGLVYDNCLKVDWTFSSEIYRSNSIQALMAEFETAVRALIARCGSSNGSEFTPSDFSGSDLSQEDLENLFGEIGEAF